MTTETQTTVDADRDDSVLPDLDVTFGRAWREHRRYVLDIAFRTLGDIGEAEDVVQEAFARLLGVDIDEIHDVRAWLVVVVGRLCIDRLRLAHRQRETSTETPPDTSRHQTAHPIDPADRVTLDDRVCTALHDVLERLTPAERTTFVLHDVFAFTFDDIGAIVGRSPEACRQLASRARRHIRTDATAPRFPVESADQRRICDVFIAACATGELDGLLAVLDPDVAGQVDLGGTIGLRPPVVGSLAVAQGLLRFYGPDSSTTLHSLPTERDVAMIALRHGHLVATITLSLRHGIVHHIHAVRDPVKLAPIAERLGARPPEPPAGPHTKSRALLTLSTSNGRGCDDEHTGRDAGTGLIPIVVRATVDTERRSPLTHGPDRRRDDAVAWAFGLAARARAGNFGRPVRRAAALAGVAVGMALPRDGEAPVLVG